MEKSIIIIGGGLAGLSAGCFAQKNGYKAQIFEHASKPGGVCMSWKRENFIIDGCIHWLIGYKKDSPIHTLYDELGITKVIPFHEFQTYMRFVDEQTGKELSFTSDPEATRFALIDAAPGDAAIVDDFINTALSLSKATMSINPPETAGIGERLRMMWQWRRMIFGMKRYGVPSEEYARNAQDPWLRKILSFFFHPRMTAVFNMMIAGFLFNKDLCTIEGGSRKFSKAIEQRFKDLGGEITYRATVKRIIVENDSATGIELADGSVHRADIVISAADLHSTVHDMLGGKYVSQRIKTMFESWELFPPIVIASFGVRGDFKAYPQSTSFFLKEPVKFGNGQCTEILVRDSSYDPTLSPEGCRVIQVYATTTYDHWALLRDKDIDRYKEEKDNLAKELLRRIEPLYPGVSGNVLMQDVATPATFYRYTRNYRGAFEGWLMNAESLMRPVEKTIPGLNSLYFAGQWVTPGGGVPTALISGRNAVQLICKAEGKTFRH